MTIDYVAKLVKDFPPPATPLGQYDWKLLEERVGGTIPEDYKQISELYGLGQFADEIYLYPPFSPPGLFEQKSMDYRTQQSRSILSTLTKENGYWDTEDGIYLPPVTGEIGIRRIFAGEEHNYIVFGSGPETSLGWWMDGDDPNEWPLFVRGDPGQFIYNISASEYLYRCLTSSFNEVECLCDPFQIMNGLNYQQRQFQQAPHSGHTLRELRTLYSTPINLCSTKLYTPENLPPIQKTHKLPPQYAIDNYTSSNPCPICHKIYNGSVPWIAWETPTLPDFTQPCIEFDTIDTLITEPTPITHHRILMPDGSIQYPCLDCQKTTHTNLKNPPPSYTHTP